jgi:hypothetical protein
VEAARRAGAVAVFVDLGYAHPPPMGQAVSVGSLREAADWILRREASRPFAAAQQEGTL